jgi:hypothetical protein
LETPPETWQPGRLALDPARRLDEVHRVVGVFLDARGHGEDVGVEDDVLGREAHLLGEHPVGAGADLGLAGIGVGLALLVEGHDHRRRAVAPGQLRPGDEFRLAFLEGDGVDDGLALDALEARLDDGPTWRSPP